MLPFAMKDERHPSPFNEYKSPVSNTNEQRGYFFFVIKMVSVIKITSGNHRPQSKNNFNEIDISGRRPSFLFLSHICFLFGTDYLRRDWLVD